ncbi:hypothetical protein ABH925_003752 [Streptacidiphilus sp. EB129]
MTQAITTAPVPSPTAAAPTAAASTSGEVLRTAYQRSVAA